MECLIPEDVVLCVRAQSCLTLCNPMDCRPLGSSLHGILQDTAVGCHFLLQGMFPTQGSNLCLLHLLHWQVNSLTLSHLEAPIVFLE